MRFLTPSISSARVQGQPGVSSTKGTIVGASVDEL